MGNSYIKLKVTEHIACFIYPFNGTYKKCVISIHPDNQFNNITDVTYSYYNNYHGNYYTFDGNYDAFNNILSTFNPTKNNLKLLINRLDCECDLIRYINLRQCIINWISTIGTLLTNIPKSGWLLLTGITNK